VRLALSVALLWLFHQGTQQLEKVLVERLKQPEVTPPEKR
jgi:hypothetical protein